MGVWCRVSTLSCRLLSIVYTKKSQSLLVLQKEMLRMLSLTPTIRVQEIEIE
mgnify:CR=1 FL=1